MSKLTWHDAGEKKYQTGVSTGVLFVYDAATKAYKTGVAWPGLVSVTSSPSGAEPTPVYADNIKYLNMISAEDYGFTIEALMSPAEFDECDGQKAIVDGFVMGQQARSTFGFSYQSLIGNDTEGNDHEKVIHIIYGATASVTEETHTTVNESPEAATLSWEASTIPVDSGEAGSRPSAYYKIYCNSFTAAQIAALEDALYGAESTESKLPTPAEIKAILTTEG